jgi:hypothetical protein
VVITDPKAKAKLERVIGERFRRLAPELDERARRLFAATEAMSVGHGGIALVARTTGMARRTISAGELATVRLTRHEFHGDWNYTIEPNP